MKVGVPTEIKKDEYRVSMTPAGVREIAGKGLECEEQFAHFRLLKGNCDILGKRVGDGYKG